MKLLKTMLEKYKMISRPVKASFWAIVCSVIQKCISFITTPIFTRILTTEQYGICSLFDSWFTIIILFTSLSIYANSFNNAMIKYESKKDEYISASLSLILIISLIFSFVCICYSSFFSNITGLSVTLLYTMMLQLIFVPSYSVWMSKKRFEFEYFGPIITTLIISFFCPVLGIIAVNITEYKAEAKIIAFALPQVILGIVFFIYSFIKGKKIFDKEIWKYVLKLNIPLIPFYLSSIVLVQADRIMIGKLVGTSEVAIYSLAYTLSLVMTMVNNAINQSLMPYIYKKIKAKEYKNINSIVTIMCLIVASFNILVMLIGPELIAFFGNREYIMAKWIVPPVAASVFIIFVYQMFGIILMYWEKTKEMVACSSVIAILNIVLNYFGIKIFGYISAGYTTLISYMILCIVYYIQYKKIIIKHLNSYKLFNLTAIIVISICVLISAGFTIILYNCNSYIRYVIMLLLIFYMILKRKVIWEVVKNIGGKNK